jgi:hypothetical protein
VESLPDLAWPDPQQCRGTADVGRRWLADYTSRDAGYAVDLPPDVVINESEDAALRFTLVTAFLPDPSVPLDQGVSILVIEEDATPEEYVAQAYEAAGQAPANARRATAPSSINGRAALRLERDPIVGAANKFTTLIDGVGVIYRLDLLPCRAISGCWRLFR